MMRYICAICSLCQGLVFWIILLKCSFRPDGNSSTIFRSVSTPSPFSASLRISNVTRETQSQTPLAHAEMSVMSFAQSGCDFTKRGSQLFHAPDLMMWTFFPVRCYQIRSRSQYLFSRALSVHRLYNSICYKVNERGNVRMQCVL